MPDRDYGFRITVEHSMTKESITFIGQGRTVIECVTDGAKLLKEPFRPSSSGAKNVPLPVHVTLADGRKVWRTVEEFESGKPYDGKTAAVVDHEPKKPTAPPVEIVDL